MSPPTDRPSVPSQQGVDVTASSIQARGRGRVKVAVQAPTASDLHPHLHTSIPAQGSTPGRGCGNAGALACPGPPISLPTILSLFPGKAHLCRRPPSSLSGAADTSVLPDTSLMKSDPGPLLWNTPDSAPFKPTGVPRTLKRLVS